MEKKPRKTKEWDPVRKSTRQYRSKILAAHREIDELAKTGENRRVQTPNYVQEVIVPLAKIIHEKLPGIVLSEKIERINAKEAYFLLQMGELTLGGFSYPGPSASHVDFTIFAHDKPWGRVYHIAKQAELIAVIARLVDFLGLDKTDGSDERQ